MDDLKKLSATHSEDDAKIKAANVTEDDGTEHSSISTNKPKFIVSTSDSQDETLLVNSSPSMDTELYIKFAYNEPNLNIAVMQGHIVKSFKRSGSEENIETNDYPDDLAGITAFNFDQDNPLRTGSTARFGKLQCEWDLVHDFSVEVCLRDKRGEELKYMRTNVSLPNGTQLTIDENETLWEFSPFWENELQVNLKKTIPGNKYPFRDVVKQNGDFRSYKGDESLCILLYVGSKIYSELEIPLKSITMSSKWFTMHQPTPSFISKRSMMNRAYDQRKNTQAATVLSFKKRKVISLRTMFLVIMSFQIIVVIILSTILLYISSYQQLYKSAERVALQVQINILELVGLTVRSVEIGVTSTGTSFLAPAYNQTSPLPNLNNTILHTLLFNFFYVRNNARANLAEATAAKHGDNQTMVDFIAELFVGTPSNIFYGVYPNNESDSYVYAQDITPVNSSGVRLSETKPGNTTIVHYYANTDCQPLNYLCPIANISTLSTTGSTINVTNRTWYNYSVNSAGVYWVPVYTYVDNFTLGTTASYRVPPDLSKPVEYVIATDLTLDALNSILAKQTYYETGYAYIRERSTDYLVASSLNVSLVYANGTRIKASDSENSKIAESDKALEENCKFLLHKLGTCPVANRIVSASPIRLTNNDWVVVAIIPDEDFVSLFNEMFSISIIVSIIFFFISLVALSFMASQTLTYQLIRCTKQLKSFSLLDFSRRLPTSGINTPVKEIARVYQGLNMMRVSLKSFVKYVPETVVRMIMRSKSIAKVGGCKRNLTIFFTDIVDFTTIAEGLSLEQLIEILSEYFSEVTDLIQENEGTVDKYIGDAVMALWNAPESVSEHPIKACETAIQYQEKMAELREDWIHRGLPGFKVRIGIHTGNCLVGNFGSSSRLNYTALGDNVNLASRLEGLNKNYGTLIMISEDTHKYVKDLFLCRPLDTVRVKGKEKPVLVYELIGAMHCVTETQIEQVNLFCQAFKYYHNSDLKAARLKFENYLLQFPEDITAKKHLQTCQNYEGREDDFNVINTMTTK